MRRIWILALIAIAFLSIQTTVTAKNGQAPHTPEWTHIIAETDPLFQDWKDASVHQLFSESSGNAKGVSVWGIEQHNRNLGYFVTDQKGENLLEYSPITPVGMLESARQGTYVYAGPGMHLFQTAGDHSGSWTNLANGEKVLGQPIHRGKVTGEDTRKVLRIQDGESSRVFTTDTNADRGVAVMIQHSLGNSQPYLPKVLPEAGQPAGYLVYTAMEKDYYVVWAITGLHTLKENLHYLEIKDVFAGAPYPLYIREDVADVNWVGSK